MVRAFNPLFPRIVLIGVLKVKFDACNAHVPILYSDTGITLSLERRGT